MTKHEKIFKAFFRIFRMTPLNEEIDEFQDKLKEQGLEIVESLNYEKYYFNPSGIAISESQLTTILEKMRKLNNELTNLSGE